MTDSATVRPLLVTARAMTQTSAFDAAAAAAIVQRIAGFAPPEIEVDVQMAVRAITAAQKIAGASHDALACFALNRLVMAMERRLD